MRAGGRHLARILRILSEKVVVGFNTLDLEGLAQDLIKDAGGTPSFKGYHGFPASICVSVNDAVVHGLPKDYVVRSGDVVSLDLGLKYQGFHTDSALTVAVGDVGKDKLNLVAVAEGALAEGISIVKHGVTTGDVGNSIESYIKEHKMGLVTELVGHGVGSELQEDPLVPNFGKSGKGEELLEGMTIAIEPMITLGSGDVKLAEDGYTYVSEDGSVAAHFEHTVVITKDGAEILTQE